MQKVWKEWWKEIRNGTPLVLGMLFTYFFIGWKITIPYIILAWYIADLRDIKWQERKKHFNIRS